MVYLLALLTGIVAGLRALTPAAAIAWAAHLGILKLGGTWLAFLASPWAVGVLTLLAVVELVTDQLPSTPSRKVPVQFGTRLAVGALVGAAISIAGSPFVGAVAGALGAFAGTLGGAAIRATLAARFGRDLPAALIEDAVAILMALAIVLALR